MTAVFDLGHVSTTEFGIGREDGSKRSYSFVPVDGKVQAALVDIVVATRGQMKEISKTPQHYDPSQKYGSHEHLYLPLNDGLATPVRLVHEANNLPTDVASLSSPAEIICYFARMTDVNSNRLTAMRRATTFKGVLKSRLIRLLTDALQLLEENVFKLDKDFDLLVETDVHILRPSGFEFICELNTAIVAAVPKNIKPIEKDLTFVDFTAIAAYASKHPRAARYLASIRMQKEAKNIDKDNLKSLCDQTGVKVHEENGKLVVDQGYFMDFLEVLDRRIYRLELVKNSPESFRAANRRKIETS